MGGGHTLESGGYHSRFLPTCVMRSVLLVCLLAASSVAQGLVLYFVRVLYCMSVAQTSAVFISILIRKFYRRDCLHEFQLQFAARVFSREADGRLCDAPQAHQSGTKQTTIWLELLSMAHTALTPPTACSALPGTHGPSPRCCS